jgi:hypothetical protein
MQMAQSVREGSKNEGKDWQENIELDGCRHREETAQTGCGNTTYVPL